MKYVTLKGQTKLVYIVKNITISAVKYALKKEKSEGRLLIADSQRLYSEFTDQSTILNWLLVGDGVNDIGYPQLSLTVKGPTKIACQRCLISLAFSINSKSKIVLAEDERNADIADSLLDSSDSYVIVCATTLNVTELIEDEILLHLPPSPRHYPVCPSDHLKFYGDKLETERNLQKFSFEILKDIGSANS